MTLTAHVVVGRTYVSTNLSPAEIRHQSAPDQTPSINEKGGSSEPPFPRRVFPYAKNGETMAVTWSFVSGSSNASVTAFTPPLPFPRVVMSNPAWFALSSPL